MMSKLKKALTAAKNIAKQPSLLNLVLNENETKKLEFLKKYPHLETLPQISLQQLTNNTEIAVDTCFLDGASMITDLALLKILANKPEVQSYFEIGTWRGESVWNVAEILDDCTTLNLSAQEMKDLGWNLKYADLHGVISKKNFKIKHIEGNTKSFDFSTLKKFDLIFIDGDHSYEMVKNDTKKVFEHLVHDKTIVVWHDYAYNPEHVRYEVFSAILDGLPKELHHKIYHVANTMCAVFLHENLSTKKFESPKTPEFLFPVKLNLK